MPDADPKTIQQINFTENLERDGNATVFFIAKEARETKLDFSNETVTVLQFYFLSIWYQYKITQYNTLPVNLSNSQLNKLKSGIKNSTKVTLNLSSNVIGNSNDEIKFPHKSFLINR